MNAEAMFRAIALAEYDERVVQLPDRIDASALILVGATGYYWESTRGDVLAGYAISDLSRGVLSSPPPQCGSRLS